MAERLALDELVEEGEVEALADADEEGVTVPIVEDVPVTCGEG